MRQLIEDKGFWMPMVLPGRHLLPDHPHGAAVDDHQDRQRRGRQPDVQDAQGAPASRPRQQIEGQSPEGPTAYALAVFLLAPVAIVVPLTISTAIGASTIVGERERGTGEFLAHSPAHEKEIYLGKLIASLLPGYATTIVGFGVYSLDREPVRGTGGGRLVLPHRLNWWVLMLWVVPPFLALTLSIVLRLSARVKSTAAAQQAAGLVTLPMIGIAYSQSTGALFGAQAHRALSWA
jgi:ABC-type Na+ efflux pump permease subunit